MTLQTVPCYHELDDRCVGIIRMAVFTGVVCVRITITVRVICPYWGGKFRILKERSGRNGIADQEMVPVLCQDRKTRLTVWTSTLRIVRIYGAGGSGYRTNAVNRSIAQVMAETAVICDGVIEDTVTYPEQLIHGRWGHCRKDQGYECHTRCNQKQ
jgi:hypothetical protein